MSQYSYAKLLNYYFFILSAYFARAFALKGQKAQIIDQVVPAYSSSTLPSAARTIFPRLTSFFCCFFCQAHIQVVSILRTLFFHCLFFLSLECYCLVLHFLLHHPTPSSPPPLLTSPPSPFFLCLVYRNYKGQCLQPQ